MSDSGGSDLEVDPSPSGPTDTCLVCGVEVLPYKVVTSDTRSGVIRGYYECRRGHRLGEHAEWWTHWNEGELEDRELILTPDLAGGGTTWSTAPVGTRWGEELTELLPYLRPKATPGTEPPSR